MTTSPSPSPSSSPRILPERLAELDSMVLLTGAHAPDHQFCAIEAANYLAGQPHSDRGGGVISEVLASFVRPLNDRASDADRQLLKPFLPRLIGTVGTRKQEQQRAFMLADWAVRVCAPEALRAAGRGEHANKLEVLPAIVDKVTARAAYAADAAAAYAADAANAATAATAPAYAAAAAAADAYAASRSVIFSSALELFDRLIAVTESAEVA